MKRFFSLLLVAFASVATMNAQVIKGDMNDDGAITMTDANTLVNIFTCELPLQYNDVVDNSSLVGTWYKNKTESITFYSDGSSDFGFNNDYSFIPSLHTILFFRDGVGVSAMNVVEATDDYIILSLFGSSTDVTYYSYIPPVKVSSITLSQTSASLEIDKTVRLTATVLPSDADDSSITWTSSNADVAMVTGGLVIGLSEGEATITACANDGSGVSASCKLIVTGVNHEYVDLGLSVKWATCNIGASKPEEYGDYFAWGETTPKDTYSWSNLKYCSGTTYEGPFTKYCTDSSYGNVDNKTVLDRDDDAAHVNWGGSWRMPTKAEQDDLCSNCTWTWTTQNGVNGYKVTGTNGNSIFLPAAGGRYGTSVSGVGSYVSCWSRSLYTDFSSYACNLRSDSDWGYAGRHCGLSVRPVCR